MKTIGAIVDRPRALSIENKLQSYMTVEHAYISRRTQLVGPLSDTSKHAVATPYH